MEGTLNFRAIPGRGEMESNDHHVLWIGMILDRYPKSLDLWIGMFIVDAFKFTFSISGNQQELKYIRTNSKKMTPKIERRDPIPST